MYITNSNFMIAETKYTTAKYHTHNTSITNKTGNATNVKHTGMLNTIVMVHTLSKDKMFYTYRQNLKNILYFILTHF